MLKNNSVDPANYREAMAAFAGAVHIVTTDGAAGRRGTTVIAACSVSDRPPTVLVCINRENPRNDAFAANGVFALNTLAHRHEPLAAAFSGQTGLAADERFALAEWERVATGAPVLSDGLAVFDCTIVQTVEVATHRIHIGRVLGVKAGSGRPLLYHIRTYHGL